MTEKEKAVVEAAQSYVRQYRSTGIDNPCHPSFRDGLAGIIGAVNALEAPEPELDEKHKPLGHSKKK